MTHEKCIVVVELAVGEDEKELGAVRGGLKGMGQSRREVPQVALLNRSNIIPAKLVN